MIYQQANQEPTHGGFYLPSTRFYFQGYLTRLVNVNAIGDILVEPDMQQVIARLAVLGRPEDLKRLHDPPRRRAGIASCPIPSMSSKH